LLFAIAAGESLFASSQYCCCSGRVSERLRPSGRRCFSLLLLLLAASALRPFARGERIPILNGIVKCLQAAYYTTIDPLR
jgi:hypothetical protein